jgi:2-haloacid dehalogenase
VYHHLVKKVGKGENEIGDVWLVSGNPFDIVGSRAVGMQAAWVDRAGKGWVDQLGELTGDVVGGHQPTIVVSDVEAAVRGIEKWIEENKR